MNDPDASAFKNLFERTSDPAAVLDETTGQVLAANAAFSKLTGWPVEELTGAQFRSLVEPDEKDDDEQTAHVFAAGGRVRVSFERVACVWEGRQATLCLLRRARGGAALDEGRTEALLGYLQEATEQVEVVNRVVAAVNSSRTIDEVFSLASEQMRSLVPFDRATIALCEP
jgi:PAS domain S-box-containing protein